MTALTDRLAIQSPAIEEINALISDPNNPVIGALLRVIEKYGTPEEINAKAAEARKLENLMLRLREMESPYLKDLEWLIAQATQRAFISMEDYKKKVLGDRAG